MILDNALKDNGRKKVKTDTNKVKTDNGKVENK
jgi:hypothetical protein